MQLNLTLFFMAFDFDDYRRGNCERKQLRQAILLSKPQTEEMAMTTAQTNTDGMDDSTLSSIAAVTSNGEIEEGRRAAPTCPEGKADLWTQQTGKEV